MIIFIGLMIGMFFLILIGCSIAISNFDKNVEVLFMQSNEIQGDIPMLKQSDNLPEPVYRYFLHVLNVPQPYLSYVRLRHFGKFKTSVNAQWSNINGEEYFTVANPGFIWKGKTRMFMAIDSFVEGKGSLKVFFLSAFRIVHGSGKKFTQGELLRWLGESVWFPTALLPGDSLRWEPIDDNHAKLLFNHNNVEVYYIVTFNENHEIMMLETRRYMDGKKLQTWIGKLSDYEIRNGVLIPTTMEAIWKVDGQEFSYAVFNLNQIEYNKPEKFK
jgi:hypothetical protein